MKYTTGEKFNITLLTEHEIEKQIQSVKNYRKQVRSCDKNKRGIHFELM
jgi:hypothetical protein